MKYCITLTAHIRPKWFQGEGKGQLGHVHSAQNFKYVAFDMGEKENETKLQFSLIRVQCVYFLLLPWGPLRSAKLPNRCSNRKWYLITHYLSCRNILRIFIETSLMAPLFRSKVHTYNFEK